MLPATGPVFARSGQSQKVIYRTRGINSSRREGPGASESDRHRHLLSAITPRDTANPTASHCARPEGATAGGESGAGGRALRVTDGRAGQWGARGRGLTGGLSADPFADASKGDDLLPAGTEDYIHIRIQQRNGRKTLTTVQGIADDYDKKKLVKAFKKKFACNGTVIEHPEYGEVIQLQGDQRKNICQFLVEIGLAKDDQLKVHGF
ncbi:PREDICTED: eukaryotic translation initiation factor 1 [Calidris pugnax]|nr:PREDICTED: eukaryotic translation initiation factor 1 [Calidris pugnax]